MLWLADLAIRKYGAAAGFMRDVKNAYEPIVVLAKFTIILSLPVAVVFNTFPFGISWLPDWDLRKINLLLLIFVFFMFVMAGFNIKNWLKVWLVAFLGSKIDQRKDFDAYFDAILNTLLMFLLFAVTMLAILGTWPFRNYPGSIISFFAGSIFYFLLSLQFKIETDTLQWLLKRYAIAMALGGGLLTPVFIGVDSAYWVKFDKLFGFNPTKILALTASEKADAQIDAIDRGLENQAYSDVMEQLKIYAEIISNNKRLNSDERSHYKELKRQKNVLDVQYSGVVKVYSERNALKKSKPKKLKPKPKPQWYKIGQGQVIGKGIDYKAGQTFRSQLVVLKGKLKNGDKIRFLPVSSESRYIIQWAMFTQGDVRTGNFIYGISGIEEWMEDGVYVEAEKGAVINFEIYRFYVYVPPEKPKQTYVKPPVNQVNTTVGGRQKKPQNIISSHIKTREQLEAERVHNINAQEGVADRIGVRLGFGVASAEYASTEGFNMKDKKIIIETKRLKHGDILYCEPRRDYKGDAKYMILRPGLKNGHIRSGVYIKKLNHPEKWEEKFMYVLGTIGKEIVCRAYRNK